MTQVGAQGHNDRQHRCGLGAADLAHVGEQGLLVLATGAGAEERRRLQAATLAVEIAAHRAGHATGPDRGADGHQIVVGRIPLRVADRRQPSGQGIPAGAEKAEQAPPVFLVDDFFDIGTERVGHRLAKSPRGAGQRIIDNQDTSTHAGLHREFESGANHNPAVDAVP